LRRLFAQTARDPGILLYVGEHLEMMGDSLLPCGGSPEGVVLVGQADDGYYWILLGLRAKAGAREARIPAPMTTTR